MPPKTGRINNVRYLCSLIDWAGILNSSKYTRTGGRTRYCRRRSLQVELNHRWTRRNPFSRRKVYCECWLQRQLSVQTSQDQVFNQNLPPQRENRQRRDLHASYRKRMGTDANRHFYHPGYSNSDQVTKRWKRSWSRNCLKVLIALQLVAGPSCWVDHPVCNQKMMTQEIEK